MSYKVYHNLRLFTFLLCLSPLFVWAQLTANIEEVNGYYQLSFTANSKKATDFTPPALGDFECLSGPNVSAYSNYQFVNGATRHQESVTYTYVLSPKHTGTVTIGAASVRIGNRTYHSNPLTVTLSTKRAARATVANATNTASHGRVSNRDIWIEVKPSKTRLFEQEAILLTYQIHVRAGIKLSNTQLSNKPDFNGLVTYELPTTGNQIQTSLEEIGSTVYRTGTILEYLVFPQQSGKVSIPGLTFDCSVIQPTDDMDLAEAFFTGGGAHAINVRRQMQPLTIDVAALPTPRPRTFCGGVGQLKVKAEMLNKTIRTNEVNTYRLTITGQGNLSLITSPQIHFPATYDVLDVKTSDSTKVTRQGLKGTIIMDYAFIPHHVDTDTIPAIPFTFFNPTTGSYETQLIPAIVLDVKQGKPLDENQSKQLALRNSDIGALLPYTKASWLTKWTESDAIYRMLQLLLLALTGALIYLKKSGLKFASWNGKRKGLKSVNKALGKLNELNHSTQSSTNANRLLELDCILQQLSKDTNGAKLSKEESNILNELHLLQSKCNEMQYSPLLDDDWVNSSILSAIQKLMEWESLRK